MVCADPFGKPTQSGELFVWDHRVTAGSDDEQEIPAFRSSIDNQPEQLVPGEEVGFTRGAVVAETAVHAADTFPWGTRNIGERRELQGAVLKKSWHRWNERSISQRACNCTGPGFVQASYLGSEDGVMAEKKPTTKRYPTELKVQTGRIMRDLGICGASRAIKRFTTKADPDHVRASDLVKRDFTATRPDQLWVADFTYCSTWSGIVYVAFIIDVNSRRLVGWKASQSMTAPLVVDALNMAAWTRRGTDLAGLICHNDAGSQYTSIAHTDRLIEIGALASIATVGDSYVHAMAESVTGLFKTELHRNPAELAANGGPWRDLDDLEIATARWVSLFNEERLHSELEDATPNEIEAAYYDHHSQPNAA